MENMKHTIRLNFVGMSLIQKLAYPLSWLSLCLGLMQDTLTEHGANDMSKADDGWWDFWGGGREEGGREKGNITLSPPSSLPIPHSVGICC